jgi:hypothetical protein
MQGSFLVDVTAAPQQQHGGKSNFCFAVPDKILRDLAGRLEASLGKEELSVLRDTVFPVVNPTDAPGSSDFAAVASKRVLEQSVAQCETQVITPSTTGSDKGPCLQSGSQRETADGQPTQQISKEQRDAVQLGAVKSKKSQTAGQGPERASQAEAFPSSELLDIQAWYWGRQRATQNVPQLPRCGPFRPPPTPPKRSQHHDQSQASVPPSTRQRRSTNNGEPAGTVPGVGQLWGEVANGRISAQVPRKQPHRFSGQKRNHCGGAVPGKGQHSQPGKLSNQDCGGSQKKKKKRCGRFVRELAESAAAERDNKIELGFNANLKQFEQCTLYLEVLLITAIVHSNS